MAGPENDARRWLSDARDGSSEALGRALEACRQYLLLVAARELDPRLQPKGGASDLVQETFLEAQRDFAQFSGTSDTELRAWLRRLLLNNVGNFARRYRTTQKRAVGREVALDAGGSSMSPGGGLRASTPTPSGEAIEREQAAELERVLERLPEDYRLVIRLRYQEGRSFEEIAGLMKRSCDATRKLWARAMERLQHEWESLP